MVVLITSEARVKIANIIGEKVDKIGFQILINMGGCSGLSYEFKLSIKSDFDEKEVFNIKDSNYCVLVDELSQKYLKNRILHYKIELGQEYFEIVHPKGVSKCGCGKSFGVV